jgi:hypothetical protein
MVTKSDGGRKGKEEKTLAVEPCPCTFCKSELSETRKKTMVKVVVDEFEKGIGLSFSKAREDTIYDPKSRKLLRRSYVGNPDESLTAEENATFTILDQAIEVFAAF